MQIYSLLFVLLLLYSVVYIDFHAQKEPVFRTSNLFWWFFFLLFVVSAFVFGYRHDVGADYWSYLSIIETASHEKRVFDRFEPGFIAAIMLATSIGLSANDVLFLFFTLTLFFFFESIRKAGYSSATPHVLALLLLFGIGPVFSSTNTVRQGLVLAMAAYACVSYCNRRIFATSASALLGSLVHYSAPIVLLFNFIPKRVVRFRSWLYWVLITLLFSGFLLDQALSLLVNKSYLLGSFGGYLQDVSTLPSPTGLGVRLVFDVFLFLFLSLYVGRISVRSVWIFNIAFVGVLLSYLLKDYAIFLRVASYFTVFKYLAIPYFYSCFHGVNRRVYVLFVILYSFLAFMRSATSEQFNPYYNVFFV